MATQRWPFEGELDRGVAKDFTRAAWAVWPYICAGTGLLGLPRSDSPARRGSALARLDHELRDAPVLPSTTVVQALSTAVGCLQVALQLVDNVHLKVAHQALTAVARPALLASGHVVYMLAEDDPNERRERCRTIAACEWGSLSKYLTALQDAHGYEEVTPPPQMLKQWTAGAQRAGLGRGTTESALMTQMGSYLADRAAREARRRRAEDAEDQVSEEDAADMEQMAHHLPRLTFNTASGVCHGWGWPAVAPTASPRAHDVAISHLVAPMMMTFDAVRCAVTRCGLDRAAS